ncbi:hypothetical protein Tco_0163144 [Tanacetum coccineum]
MRYIDIRPNGDALRKCILQGPYTLYTVTIPSQPVTDDTPAVEEQTVLETLSNISPENKAHYDAEKEAIHLLLTGIGDEIYSTVDACKTSYEMWIAIKRLQQGESLNKQDVMTSLFWEFGKFTSRDGESIESYYSRFYKMLNEMVRNQLEVATMPVNVQLAKNANLIALFAAAQQYLDLYYQGPNSHKSCAPPLKQLSSTRSHAPTRYKGKEIAKPNTPPSESASKEDNDPKQAQRDKDMQKNLELIAKYFKRFYKTCYNNNLRNFLQTPKTKSVDNSQLCILVLLESKHHCAIIRNLKVDEQELEASTITCTWKRSKRQHSEQPVSINNTCLVEKVDSNGNLDSSYMCDNENQADQNAEECDDERGVLANLLQI